MSVYIDQMDADYGRMKMCHMCADSTEELLAMADKIGLARGWIQKKGTRHEHFDVCLSKKKAALAAGAIELTRREFGLRLLQLRQQAGASAGDEEGIMSNDEAVVKSI